MEHQDKGTDHMSIVPTYAVDGVTFTKLSAYMEVWRSYGESGVVAYVTPCHDINWAVMIWRQQDLIYRSEHNIGIGTAFAEAAGYLKRWQSDKTKLTSLSEDGWTYQGVTFHHDYDRLVHTGTVGGTAIVAKVKLDRGLWQANVWHGSHEVYALTAHIDRECALRAAAEAVLKRRRVVEETVECEGVVFHYKKIAGGDGLWWGGEGYKCLVYHGTGGIWCFEIWRDGRRMDYNLYGGRKAAVYAAAESLRWFMTNNALRKLYETNVASVSPMELFARTVRGDG